MSHHTIEELIELWKHEKLTAEQAIGQILQVLRAHEQRLRGRPAATPGSGPPPAGGPRTR